MRHAESLYNAMQSQYNKETNVTDPKYSHTPNRWIINNDIVDTLLSPLGDQQSYEATEVLNNYPNIKYVWVSP